MGQHKFTCCSEIRAVMYPVLIDDSKLEESAHASAPITGCVQDKVFEARTRRL